MGTLNCKKYGFCVREILCKRVSSFCPATWGVWGYRSRGRQYNSGLDRVPSKIIIVCVCVFVKRHNAPGYSSGLSPSEARNAISMIIRISIMNLI